MTLGDGPKSGRPLLSRAVYRTHDPMVASREGSELFVRYQLRVVDDAARLDARAHVADLHDIRVNYVSFGTRVELDRSSSEKFVAVLIPIAGQLMVEHDGGMFTVGQASRSAVLLGTGRMRLSWSADCEVLSFTVAATQLSRQLARMAPAVDAGPLTFATRPLVGNPVAALLGLAWLITDTFDRSGTRSPTESILAQLRRTVLTTLLLSVPHSHSRLMLSTGPEARRRPVEAAVELIEAETEGSELTVVELAQRVGVGLRALELAFRHDLGTTPARYLRDMRLRRARQELLDAEPASGLRVQEVAQRWGFFHTGRFSRLYQERFGEYPSITLARFDEAG